MKHIHIFTLLGLCSLSSFSSLAIDCSNIHQWSSSKAYTANQQVQHEQKVYEANWWTTAVPGSDSSWQFVCNKP